MHPPMDIHTLDRARQILIVERRLPHWSQAGAITFITWRTDDSIPEHVLKLWRADRCRWLRAHHIDPDDPAWKTQFACLKTRHQAEFHRMFSDRWHAELDAGYGECLLRRPELAKVVVDSLHHFDDERYSLTDYVIMPNHVHLLAAFCNEGALLTQCESWKHFTATQINRRLGRKGRFWEQDGFDHIVRNDGWFEYYRRYIAENAFKAQLNPGEFVHYSKRLLHDDERG
jgi:type I restriction enzyme R subunit